MFRKGCDAKNWYAKSERVKVTHTKLIRVTFFSIRLSKDADWGCYE